MGFLDQELNRLVRRERLGMNPIIEAMSNVKDEFGKRQNLKQSSDPALRLRYLNFYLENWSQWLEYSLGVEVSILRWKLFRQAGAARSEIMRQIVGKENLISWKTAEGETRCASVDCGAGYRGHALRGNTSAPILAQSLHMARTTRFLLEDEHGSTNRTYCCGAVAKKWHPVRHLTQCRRKLPNNRQEGEEGKRFVYSRLNVLKEEEIVTADDPCGRCYDRDLVSSFAIRADNKRRYILARDCDGDARQLPNPFCLPWCRHNRSGEGAMIQCDNDNCTNAWYHLDCLGLSAVPSGDFYCGHNCQAPSTSSSSSSSSFSTSNTGVIVKSKCYDVSGQHTTA
jgi:hypothetical protein